MISALRHVTTTPNKPTLNEPPKRSLSYMLRTPSITGKVFILSLIAVGSAATTAIAAKYNYFKNLSQADRSGDRYFRGN